MATPKTRSMTGSQFLALPDAEKEKLWNELDAQMRGMDSKQARAHSKPLNAKEKREWRDIKKKISRGRPKLGADGTDNISVSVEKSLLREADQFARRHKLKRSQMVARGLQLVMQAGA